MNNKGVIYVTQVFKNTPAEKAGLKPDDILVALDGESLEGKTTAEVASVIKKGTKSEFKAMCDEADKYGIKVIVDLVANHCSTKHRWFQEAIKDKNSKYHDYFYFFDEN